MIKLLFPLALLAGCATSDPTMSCKGGELVRCLEPDWYTPWSEAVCEPLIDALTEKPVQCE